MVQDAPLGTVTLPLMVPVKVPVHFVSARTADGPPRSAAAARATASVKVFIVLARRSSVPRTLTVPVWQRGLPHAKPDDFSIRLMTNSFRCQIRSPAGRDRPPSLRVRTLARADALFLIVQAIGVPVPHPRNQALTNGGDIVVRPPSDATLAYRWIQLPAVFSPRRDLFHSYCLRDCIHSC